MLSSVSSRSRGSIAAQACETCRKRKSKCDELRPRCSLCQRLNLDCRYKEAEAEIAQRQDEALADIMGGIQRLETRLEKMSSANLSSMFSPGQTGGGSSSQQTPRSNPSTGSPRRESALQQESRNDLPRTYTRHTVPHRVLVWPAVYSRIINTGTDLAPELQAMYQRGTPWLVRHTMNRHGKGLPFDVGLPALTVNIGPSQPGYMSKVSFPGLTMERMKQYTDTYFATFNISYPVLDHTMFMTDTLAPLLTDGFGYGDTSSVLALLVFALGELALGALFGSSVNPSQSESGIRGGTSSRPPGLELFNEARARVGAITFQCDLQDVQVLLLQAAFFEANACHTEFWRSTVAASTACQLLAQHPGTDWQTPLGDLIKRCYWACVINEGLYHCDLDLPSTTIHHLEDTVPFPHFPQAQSQAGSSAWEGVGFVTQYHFLAKAALKRLIARIHDAIHLHSYQSESFDDYQSPPLHVVKEMARQLEYWRTSLPSPLQWSDDDISHATDMDPIIEQFAKPSLWSEQSGIPLECQSGPDVICAELRTRYYYARFILYRPFIFKALHYPQFMSIQDSEYCSYAIRAACLWPITLAPTRQRKRLISHLFTWTQNFVGILLIMWMSQENECLRNICNEHLDTKAMENATRLMLHWIEDVKQIDGIAEWSWAILEPLYSQSPQ